MQETLNSAEAAPLIGVTPKTLANWRTLGKGPAHIKSGTRVTYDPAEIAAWRASRRRTSTSQDGAA